MSADNFILKDYENNKLINKLKPQIKELDIFEKIDVIILFGSRKSFNC